MENCDAKDHRNDECAAEWNTAYETYRERILVKEILEQEDFQTLLTQLGNSQFGIFIEHFGEFRLSDIDIKLLDSIPNLYGVSEADYPSTNRKVDIRVNIYDHETGEELAVKYFRKGTTEWEEMNI